MGTVLPVPEFTFAQPEVNCTTGTRDHGLTSITPQLLLIQINLTNTTVACQLCHRFNAVLTVSKYMLACIWHKSAPSSSFHAGILPDIPA